MEWHERYQEMILFWIGFVAGIALSVVVVMTINIRNDLKKKD